MKGNKHSEQWLLFKGKRNILCKAFREALKDIGNVLFSKYLPFIFCKL